MMTVTASAKFGTVQPSFDSQSSWLIHNLTQKKSWYCCYRRPNFEFSICKLRLNLSRKLTICSISKTPIVKSLICLFCTAAAATACSESECRETSLTDLVHPLFCLFCFFLWWGDSKFSTLDFVLTYKKNTKHKFVGWIHPIGWGIS